jgi:hypothetical protein
MILSKVVCSVCNLNIYDCLISSWQQMDTLCLWYSNGSIREMWYCPRCQCTTEFHFNPKENMSQETLQPEDYKDGTRLLIDAPNPQTTPPPLALSQADIMGAVVPMLQEVKDEVLGLSELRCRVELAKAFIFRDPQGNIHFKRTNFEEVWAAIIGETPVTPSTNEGVK